jgi:hypothetical protein
LTLALTPVASFAMCSADHVKESASTCAPGTHWDPEKITCVPSASS